MPADWDGATYDRVADPQTGWGRTVLDRLDLTGAECVLDAGCGSGRVTEALLERLPAGKVIAVDASPSMVDEAQRRLRRFGGRVELLLADLLHPLPLAEPVDAVLSTATFHWIPDHDRLFRNLALALRPGGQLVAQCGGTGNIASVMRALASIGDGWLGPVYFAGPHDTRARLEAAGFRDVQTWLHEEPTRFEAGEPFERFLATVVLREHLARLPEPDRRGFVREVASRLPAPVIDYVRLNIVARRAEDDRRRRGLHRP